MGKIPEQTIRGLTAKYFGRAAGRMRSADDLDAQVMESAAAPQDGISASELVERWEISEAFLLNFIQTELENDAGLVELAKQTLRDGREGIALIGRERDSTDVSLDRIRAGLEVVVHTDGTRPAFIIRHDDIVEDSSPSSSWTDLLTDETRRADIRATLGSVGRVDVDHPGLPFAGTAWMITEDLVVTNRHVAQIFVNFFTGGAPALMPARNAHVDFGHELNGDKSKNRRKITELVFCGANPIPEIGIDHSLLDIAVFRLAPKEGGSPQRPLALGLGNHLAEPQTQVVIIGYPAKPSEKSLGTVTETDKVLKLLFNKLWGHKRLAPGEIMPGTIGPRTLSHDASTLGGNSGSLVMGIDSTPLVTGLHYGGQWTGDRVNWGHVLESVLDEQGLEGLRYPTLRGLAHHEEVKLVPHGL